MLRADECTYTSHRLDTLRRQDRDAPTRHSATLASRSPRETRTPGGSASSAYSDLNPVTESPRYVAGSVGDGGRPSSHVLSRWRAKLIRVLWATVVDPAGVLGVKTSKQTSLHGFRRRL